MYKKRELKVSYTWQNKKCIPSINLSGGWVRSLGFEIGDTVNVEMIENRLIIENLTIQNHE